MAKSKATSLRAGFEKAGKKLDTIGAVVAGMPMREWIAIFEASRRK